ncbi:hypothetical protein F2P56_014251 [Juglans regia]|uniref:Uncharacterized protein n=1 Tax=Juglans regia TaxID=51240 RepID=A0A833XDH5_JUGRE|nr:hypothetical protein F2P56_014251 [Juglans regia]
MYHNFDGEVKIEFVTKYRSLSYKGSVLAHMFGLDLSCNNLTGGIPLELGQISSIIALNLSYNQLDGTIPKTFSNLALLESLDLSHNSLRGEIPSKLIDLNFLAVFNMAHNNLSGKVPDMKAQFGTFEKSSYEGNLFLYGPPLDKSCTKVNKSDPRPTQFLVGLRNLNTVDISNNGFIGTLPNQGKCWFNWRRKIVTIRSVSIEISQDVIAEHLGIHQGVETSAYATSRDNVATSASSTGHPF